MRPAHGLLLVRPIHTQETFANSVIVIPEAARERIAAHQVEVVAVGEPERCQDEDCNRPHTNGRHPCTLKAGDWIVIVPRSLVATDDERLWLVRQDNVLGRFTVPSSATVRSRTSTADKAQQQ